uniref:Cupin 2 conserved barrel domain-containing protein n=1 Tax=viral metagenome TaxID=1070528 RepID=A0A6C0LNE2_9ZZZZ
MEEEEYVSVYEYEKNVNPHLAHVPFYEKDINHCDYGISIIDFSNIFKVSHKSTTPNLLASFIKLSRKGTIELNNDDQSIEFNATSHMFYIIKGDCSIDIVNDVDNENMVCSGDILIAPCFNSIKIKNLGKEELHIYYINDSPLVNYLGNKAIKQIFKTAIYRNEFLVQKLNELSNKNNNRKGILLSNKDTDALGINTITPVLWTLYNELPPKTIQKPHKHNSVALDLCIKCSDSENIYTLIGDELDENGNIVNPKKVYWKEGSMFITPPGLWHSHNNDGNTYAYILPVQDAGLLLYQRILGIVLQK